MKIDFDLPSDNALHKYCISCHSENVTRFMDNGRTMYHCSDCGRISDRMVVIDPAIHWWIGGDGEYWHESVGVMIVDEQHRILLFERIIFPFAFTIPAGHLDMGNMAGTIEEPEAAARREVREEVGLEIDHVTWITTEDVPDDSCRRGCDAHRWHLYRASVPNTPVTVNDEGHTGVWLSADDALKKNLTVPVRRFIKQYKNLI